MKSGYTDVTVILDRSGSMGNLVADMEGGYERFIEEQRKLPGECRVTLVQFDTGGIETVYESMLVQDVPRMFLKPRGGTPLLDAVGTTIERTGQRLKALPETERPERVMVIIMTDGQENSSRTFSKERVQRMVLEQTTVYQWAFVYLGANVDAFQEASAIGVSINTNYSPDSVGVRTAFAAMSNSLASYRSGGSADVIAPDLRVRSTASKKSPVTVSTPE